MSVWDVPSPGMCALFYVYVPECLFSQVNRRVEALLGILAASKVTPALDAGCEPKRHCDRRP
jgi:hypothetical protein